MMSRGKLQELRLAACVAAVVGAIACGSEGGPAASAPVARTARATQPQVAPKLTAYRVHPGDSLSRLAACSGVSVAELAKSNQIADPDLLIAGERLQLPQGHRCAAAKSDARSATRAATGAGDPAAAARARADRLLATANARLDAADFEASLASAESCARALESHAPDTKASAIGARCHFVAGMAAAGLDRRERAIEEFRRAFVLDPNLELEPEKTSPRIVELLSAARPSPAP